MKAIDYFCIYSSLLLYLHIPEEYMANKYLLRGSIFKLQCMSSQSKVFMDQLCLQSFYLSKIGNSMPTAKPSLQEHCSPACHPEAIKIKLLVQTRTKSWQEEFCLIYNPRHHYTVSGIQVQCAGTCCVGVFYCLCIDIP